MTLIHRTISYVFAVSSGLLSYFEPLCAAPAVEGVNIDFGLSHLVPSMAYSGAADAGYWNAVDSLDSSPVGGFSDLSNNNVGWWSEFELSASESLFDVMPGVQPFSGDNADFLGDYLASSSNTFELRVHGLPVGNYTFTFIGMGRQDHPQVVNVAPQNPALSDVDIEGIWEGSFAEGQSHATFTFDVVDAEVLVFDIFSVADGFINGLQIRLNETAPTLSLNEALDAPELNWVTSGEAPWLSVSGEDYTDGFAAKSGDSRATASYLETQVSGPGRLSFNWLLDSPVADQMVTFYLDDTIVEQWDRSVDWGRNSIAVPDGQHTLRFQMQDFGVGDDDEAGQFILDEMEWVANARNVEPVMQASYSSRYAVGASFALNVVISDPDGDLARPTALDLPNGARLIRDSLSNFRIYGDAQLNNMGRSTVRIAGFDGALTSALEVDLYIDSPYPNGLIHYEDQKYVGDDPASYRFLGRSVLSGDNSLFASAYSLNLSQGPDASVYCFTENQDVWELEQIIESPTTPRRKSFGSALGYADGLLAVGNWQEASTGNSKGAVYIYKKEAEEWTEVNRLAVDGIHDFAAYGKNLAFHSGLLAVAANIDAAFQNEGAVYLYEIANDGSSSPPIILNGGPTEDNQLFGAAIAMEDDWLAVASRELVNPETPGVIGSRGLVYLYRIDRSDESPLSAASFRLVSVLDPVVPWSYRDFTGRLEIHDDKLFGHVRGWDVANDNSDATGAVIVYSLEPENESANQMHLFQREGSGFSGSIAASNGLLAISGGNDNGFRSGGVTVFDLNKPLFPEIARFVGSDCNSQDDLGHGLTIASPWVIAGAPAQESGPFNSSGSLYFFKLSTFSLWADENQLSVGSGAGDDLDGNGVHDLLQYWQSGTPSSNRITWTGNQFLSGDLHSIFSVDFSPYATGLSYEIETSLDLNLWVPNQARLIDKGPPALWAIPNASEDSMFLRVRLNEGFDSIVE